MSFTQPTLHEGREQAQNVTARRGRAFAEEHEDDIALKRVSRSGSWASIATYESRGSISKTESRGFSGDEGESSRRSSMACQFPPPTTSLHMPVAVDLGRNVGSLFPASLEEREKQIVSVLQNASSSTKSKVNERPVNFGQVVPGVYRSSFPIEEDIEYLKTLGLRTILSLVKKEFSPEFKSFMRNNGIRHHVIDMAGTKKVDIPDETMQEIMSVVLAKENHPLLIHCNHGKHRTGCAVAVLRHVAGWNLDSIISEYQGYAEPKVRDCDIKYINNYQVSNLQHLFTRRTQRHQHVQKRRDFNVQRMVMFTIFSMVTVFVWTTTCWHWSRNQK